MARDDLKRGAVSRERPLTHREERHLRELRALIVAMPWIRVRIPRFCGRGDAPKVIWDHTGGFPSHVRILPCFGRVAIAMGHSGQLDLSG